SKSMLSPLWVSRCALVRRLESALSLGVAPSHFRQRARRFACLQRLLAGGGAIQVALEYSLQDARQPEHVVGQVKAHVLFAQGFAGALAVAGDVFLLAGYAQRIQVQAADAAELAGR